MNKQFFVFILVLLLLGTGINHTSFAMTPQCIPVASQQISDKLLLEILTSIKFKEPTGTLLSEIDNGLTVLVVAPLQDVNMSVEGVTMNSMGSLCCYPAVKGIQLKLENKSNLVKVLRWAESSMTIGTFSGIPFLDGMKYIDAGSPTATPNTVLAPGQTMTVALNISRTKRTPGSRFSTGTWEIESKRIPANSGISGIIALKVITDNVGKYYSIKIPTIITE